MEVGSRSEVLEYRTAALPWWVEWLAAPVGRGFYWVLGVGVMGVLWESRDPGSVYGWVFGVVVIVGMGMFLGIRGGIRRGVRRTFRLPEKLREGRGRPGRVLLAVAILLVGALLGEVPARVGFWVSEAAMRRRAAAAVAGAPAAAEAGTSGSFADSGREEWVGVYRFDSVTCLPGGAVFFYLRDGGVFEDGGWTYSPGGVPSGPVGEAGPAKHEALGGGWYRSRLEW